MSLDTYRLTCPQHGTFTGQAGVDHAADCLGAKAGTLWHDHHYDRYGDIVHQRRTWRPCDQVVKARPWKAPKAPSEAPAAFLAKIAEQSAKFGDVTHEYVTDASEVAA